MEILKFFYHRRKGKKKMKKKEWRKKSSRRKGEKLHQLSFFSWPVSWSYFKKAWRERFREEGDKLSLIFYANFEELKFSSSETRLNSTQLNLTQETNERISEWTSEWFKRISKWLKQTLKSYQIFLPSIQYTSQ